MSTQPPSDVMTLAGLALANGPWLAVRLRRLAEHAGHPLSEEIAESAVLGSSRVLAQVIEAEGRPAVSADHETDPAALLGRELAQVHRLAGLGMPESLRVLRLLRRDFDDLVRESWVDKDSRARAHEDVERFFERMLIGHFLAWAGSVAAPAPAAAPAETERLAGLLAQREGELQKAMDAVRQAVSGQRESRDRVRELAAELAQAQAWAKTQLETQEQLKAELLAARELADRIEAGAEDGAALKAQFAATQARTQARIDVLLAEAKTHEAQRAELEARLAEAKSSLGAQREVEEARELALAEIDNARAEADAAREELSRARQEAQEAITRAESQALLARREAEQAREQAQRDVDSAQAEADAAVDELRRAREGHATLASEAEAMRARLSETGSRMTEDSGSSARLAQAVERAKALESKLREVQQNLEVTSARLAEQESLHAFKDERMREQSRAVTETQELLVRLGATKDEIISRAQTAEIERDQMRAELAAAVADRDKSLDRAKTLEAERADLAKRLAQAAKAQEAERAEVKKRLAQAAKAQEAERAEEKKRQAQAAKAQEAERLDLAKRLAKVSKAQDQAMRQALAAAQARDACTRLLSTYLALTPDAVATADISGAIAAWNPRFPELFGLSEADRASGLKVVVPRLAERLQRPEPWLARVRELMADPKLVEEGQTLATTSGQTLVFRSLPASGAGETGERLFSFRDVSLERDMEHLVREIEGITRDELGQSVTAFIHLPQELLDDPATTPEQAEKLTRIRESGYRIVNTVNMAVDLFRMERGLYQMPAGRTLDLAVVTRRAAKDLGRLAASRHVELELLLGDAPLPADAKLPGPGYAIPAHALVLNLLRDALEAAPRQSKVQARLALDQAAGRLCLDVVRLGALRPDEQVRFFDKPLGTEAKDGLARARYAARLITGSLGGTLDVAASPETGTTLSLRLPKG